MPSMHMPKLRWTFLVAVLVGALVVVVPALLDKPAAQSDAFVATPLVDGIWIAAQVSPSHMPDLAARGFRSLIDLRPDGEAADQPTSLEVGAAAHGSGLSFSYVPVEHGDVPDVTVGSLAQALAGADRPVLLYCRSGRRAVRTWALAEAARAGGLDAITIASAARSAGQPIDDLGDAIGARIAARASQ